MAEELDARYAAIPVFAAGTGLRPEEWIALERPDIDRDTRVVWVRRRFSGSALKDGTKTVTLHRLRAVLAVIRQQDRRIP